MRLNLKRQVHTLSDIIPFGKHKGEVLEDVAMEDPLYLLWLTEHVKDFDMSVEVIELAEEYLPYTNPDDDVHGWDGYYD